MGLQGQLRVVLSGFGPVGLGSPRAHRAADDTADGAYRPSKRRTAGAQGLEHGTFQAAAAPAQHTAERRAHLCSGLGVGAEVGVGGRGCGCGWVRVRRGPRQGPDRWRRRH
jgi:hypothetical protein